MKRILIALAAASAAGCMSTPGADVGASLTVGEPGFYGRIDIGDMPRPQLIYRQPVVIQRARMGGAREPIYLHVPPGHERNWRQHCREYGACDQPVYFVQDRWYRETYVPYYRERSRGDRHEERHDPRQDDGQDRDHDKGSQDN